MENEECQRSTPAGIGIPAEVFCNCELSQTEKMLFGYIQNLSKSSDGCWASNNYLGKIVGVGEQSITNSLKALKDFKYIVVEIDRSAKGTSRRVFVDTGYLFTYKGVVEFFYDNLDALDADGFIDGLRGAINKAMGGHKQICDIKEDIKEEDPISQGEMSKAPPAQLDPRPQNGCCKKIERGDFFLCEDADYYLNPYKKFTEDARELFDYWNGLGKPIHCHNVYVNGQVNLSKSKTGITSSFTKGMRSLDNLLNRGFSKEEIKKSMENYKWLLCLDNFSLKKVSGTVVGLSEFVEFSGFTVEQVKRFNKPLAEKGVRSWFAECMKDRDTLEARWSSLAKDEYPDETAELKRLWREFGGRRLNALDDENIFRRIAVKAHNYFDGVNGKYHWGVLEKYTVSKLHYLFDALQAGGQDWKKAQPQFLLSPKMFGERLPMHWEKIAMPERLPFAGVASGGDCVVAKERKEFNSHLSDDESSSREKTLALISNQIKDRRKKEGRHDEGN